MKALIILTSLTLLMSSCSKKDTATVTPVTKSSAKDITKFSFSALSPAVDATIDATAKTITANVPAATDLTKLVPTITVSDKASVSPATGIAQDFSNAINYTVTAEDASTQVYKVSVTLPKPVDNGTLYIGNYDGILYALDALTGIQKWQVQMPAGIISTPTYVNGVIYISCLDKKIYALNASDGSKKWEFLHNKPNDFSAPMVVNGIVYIGGAPKIYAIDANSGTEKWSFEGDGIYDWESSPTVVNGIVYGMIRGDVGGKSGMYALDAQSGAVKWGPGTIYKLSESSPCVVDGIAYAGAEWIGNLISSGLAAVDANNGSTLWTFKTSDVITVSSPTVSNGILYIGSWDKKLHAINAKTGIQVWEYLTGDWINSSPIVSNGMVYFGSNDYKLYALDAATGAKKWEVLPENYQFVESSPVVANGLVYIGIGKKVYAFDANNGTKKWEFLSSRGFVQSSPVVVLKDGTVYNCGVSGMQQ